MGVATAAYQVEGAAGDDGRGPSIWDTFSHAKGNTVNGDTGDVADDQYHRYKEDVALMKPSAKAYRFSVSWSRVFPSGDGKPNPQGLDYYHRLVDELLANGIEPWVTSFTGTFRRACRIGSADGSLGETAEAFAAYAAHVTKSLSDRVTNYFTVNELSCFTDLGHERGIFAPGFRLEPKGANQVRHHGLLAHGLAQAIPANARQRVTVGIADNPSFCVPMIESRSILPLLEKRCATSTRRSSQPSWRALS